MTRIAYCRLLMLSCLAFVLPLFTGCAPDEDPILFEADNDIIAPGEPVSLHWEIADSPLSTTQTVQLLPDIGMVEASGEQEVFPLESTTYRLVVTSQDSDGVTQIEERAVDILTLESNDTPNGSSGSDTTLLDTSTEQRQVKNFNNNLRRISGVKKVNIVRVTMPGRKTPTLGQIRNSVNKLNRLYRTASRGRLSLEIGSVQTKEVARAGCRTAKNHAMRGTGGGGALVTIYMMPSGVCGFSNAGNGKVFLKGNLFRNFAHEVGHVLGLGHSNRNMAGTPFAGYKDPSSYMGSYPAYTYAISQLHWLGWTAPHEVVRINDDLDKQGYIDVPLRPINGNAASDSRVPIAYVYDMPDSDSRLFISIPRGMGSNMNSIKAGEIFVHRAKTGRGCRGICMNSALFARIAKPFHSRDVEIKRTPLIINPIAFQAEKVRVKGKQENRFTEVTLRISLNPLAEEEASE